VRNDSVKITGDRVWKILKIRWNSLKSIHHKFIWKKGWNLCPDICSNQDIFVMYGFHVYLEKPSDDRALSFDGVIAEFEFDLKDLIATGYHDFSNLKQAVFKRLKLDKKEYARIMESSHVLNPR